MDTEVQKLRATVVADIGDLVKNFGQARKVSDEFKASATEMAKVTEAALKSGAAAAAREAGAYTDATGRWHAANGKFLAGMKGVPPVAKQATDSIKQTSSALKDIPDAAGRATRSLSELAYDAAKLYVGFQTIKKGAELAWDGISGAVRTASQFDAGMSKIAAISGSSVESLGALRAAAIDLGTATVYSSSQVAEGMATLAAAGIDQQSDIIAAMPGLLDMAAASGANFGQATEIAAGAMNAFHLRASDMTHISDVLALGAQKSAVSISDLGYSLKYVGPIAQASGISLEEVTSALTAMGQANIKGEQAGTTLRAMLTSLVQPSQEAAAMMDLYKIRVTDAYGQMKSIAEISDIFRSRLAGLTEQQRNAALATIFGREALSGSLAVISAGSAGISQLTEDFEAADGVGHQMATTMQDNLPGAVEQFNGQLEALSITLAHPVSEALKAATVDATDLLSGFNKVASEGMVAITREAPGVGSALTAMVVAPIQDLNNLIQALGAALQGLNAVRNGDIAGAMKALFSGASAFAGMTKDERGILGTAADVIDAIRPAKGGLIVGPGSGTSDSIPAMVSNGEFVSTAAATSRNAAALFAGNAGATLTAHFAAGGLVGGVQQRPPDSSYIPGVSDMAAEFAGLGMSTAMLRNQEEALRATTAATSSAMSVAASKSYDISGVGDAIRSRMSSMLSNLDAELAEPIQNAANVIGSIGDADADLYSFANGVKDAADAANSWIDGVYAGSDAWLNATEDVKQLGNGARQAAKAAADGAAEMETSYGDLQKMADSGSKMPIDPKTGRPAETMTKEMDMKTEILAKTFSEQIKTFGLSIFSDVRSLFSHISDYANQAFANMSKGVWSAQNGNPFVDLKAVQNMQEGNLRLLQTMDALAAVGMAVKHGWDDMATSMSERMQKLQNVSLAEMIMSQHAKDAALSARHLADEAHKAADVVRDGGLYQAQAAQAAADATSLATQTAAMGLSAAGQAGLDTAGMLGYASSALGASAADAASAIQTSAYQIVGAGAGALSAIAQQVAAVGASMPASVLGQADAGNAGPMGIDQYQGGAGLEHIGGGLLSGVYSGGPRGSGTLAPGGWLNAPNRPIVLQIDGRQIWASIQDQGAHYGQQNTGAGWP